MEDGIGVDPGVVYISYYRIEPQCETLRLSAFGFPVANKE